MRYAWRTKAIETIIDLCSVEQPRTDEHEHLDFSSNVARLLTFIHLDLGVLKDNRMGSGMQCYCGGVTAKLSITSNAATVCFKVIDNDRFLESVSILQKKCNKRDLRDVLLGFVI